MPDTHALTHAHMHINKTNIKIDSIQVRYYNIPKKAARTSAEQQQQFTFKGGHPVHFLSAVCMVTQCFHVLSLLSVVMVLVFLSWSFFVSSSLEPQLFYPGTSFWHCSLLSCLSPSWVWNEGLSLSGFLTWGWCQVKDLKEAYSDFYAWQK